MYNFTLFHKDISLERKRSFNIKISIGKFKEVLKKGEILQLNAKVAKVKFIE